MGRFSKFTGVARTVTRLPRFQIISGCLILLQFLNGRCLGQPSAFPDVSFWTPDGTVNAIVVTNHTIYLGGDFTYVGPRTGPLGVFDAGTGQSLGLPAAVAGVVRAVIPDGLGGWFIGGAFTRVGDRVITNLARLHPDLSLDVDWNARLVGSTVNALALDAGRLYVGGSFTRIGGVARPSLAAVNANNGSLVAWVPGMSGSVNAMAIANGLLYVGGNFSSVGVSNRANLAALTLDTSAVTPWRPEPDSTVLALAVAGSTIYAGGSFAQIGTKPRARLAALDDAAGVASNWNPNPNGTVRALAVSGSSVYVGGDFTTIGGQNRRGVAAINAANGAAQSFNMQLQSAATANQVRTLLIVDNLLYVGGSFTGAFGAPALMIACADLGTGLQVTQLPLATAFNGAASAAYGINAIGGAQGQIAVGGEFLSIGGVARQHAAALSTVTGEVLPWAPAFSGSVLTLAYGTNRIYAGGSFTNFNGTNTVNGLVALDPLDGNHLNFAFEGTNASRDTVVQKLFITPTGLYVGGNFTGISGTGRRFLAMIDSASGALVTGFDARLGGGSDGVHALALAGATLYFAGDFTSVNSQSRSRLAAVSATTGAAVAWAPAPNQPVTSLAAGSELLYVGGNFTSIAATALRNFAAFNLSDNTIAGLDAALSLQSQGITALAVTPNTLYVAGDYDSIGGEFRQYLASLVAFNAASQEWDPAPNSPPLAMALSDDLVCLGGSFRSVGRSPTNRVQGFLAVYRRPPQFARVTASAGSLQIIATTGDRADCVLQGATSLVNPVWTNLATNELPGYTWTLTQPNNPSGWGFYRLLAR